MRHSPWFGAPVGKEQPELLFAVPYAGLGASAYRPWPISIGNSELVALQPPGRENRLKEPVVKTIATWARELIGEIEPLLDRPFRIVGHCGAVPFIVETVFQLEQLGLALPIEIISSSWGSPDGGLYGPLNHCDLRHTDLRQDVKALMISATGKIVPELVDMAAEVLYEDLVVERTYAYPIGWRIPVPVLSLAWTRDDVVPVDVVEAGWERCADVTHVTLEGEHLDYMRFVDPLAELLESRLGGPGR